MCSARFAPVAFLFHRKGAVRVAVEHGAGLDARLRAALATHSIKDAAALVSAETGEPKRAVYARALLLAREKDAG